MGRGLRRGPVRPGGRYDVPARQHHPARQRAGPEAAPRSRPALQADHLDLGEEGRRPARHVHPDPAYIPWWAKQRAIEEWSCWLGRYAQPSIWATPGPNAVPVCVTDSQGNQTVTQPTELLLNALLQFKSASVLALPYGSEVNLLEAKGDAQPFIDSIKAFNTEITRAILGQHLATAEGDNQSRAAADVHALVLRIFINSLRRFIAASIERDLIKPLIEGNYGDVGHLMPVVDLGDGDGWAPTVTEIAVLMQSGYFTVDQLPKLDVILGLPVRETSEPAGPAAANAYYKAITDAQDVVPPTGGAGSKNKR
jgi:hypothetical protein